MKGLEKKLDFDGVEITVRELTVGEVRNWLKAIETLDVDIAGDLLFEDFALRDFEVMTDASAATIEAMTPSQLMQLMEACREVNGSFFGMRDRLMKLGMSLGQKPVAS